MLTLDMLFCVSSPHSNGYTARPHREQHSANEYTTAIFVYSHKVHCTVISVMCQCIFAFKY